MKNRKILITTIISVILIVLLSWMKSNEKTPPDWTPTFYNTSTEPYGTYIAYDLLKDIFDKKKIQSTRQPVYNNLKSKLNGYITYTREMEEYDNEDDEGNSITPVNMSFYDSIKALDDTTAYLFINDDFELDKVDLSYFLNFVAVGNNVFISAENISKNLLDTLKIIQKLEYYYETDSIYTLTDFTEKKYRFKNVGRYTRLNLDSCKCPSRVLAKNNKSDTVFVQIQYGKGNIYMHTLPIAFTNFNLLNPKKYDFAFRCLSYIPQNNSILWDEYQKQGLLGEQSFFRVMLNSTPLRIALYLILIGLILYMIFESKRIQRPIPVIKPPVNSSLEFVDTLSNLYYRKNDFKTIAKYRMGYLLDFIRNNYHIPTENIDSEFIDFLQAKSGMEKDKLQNLFDIYKNIEKYPSLNKSYFIEFNNLLEEFYKLVKN